MMWLLAMLALCCCACGAALYPRTVSCRDGSAVALAGGEPPEQAAAAAMRLGSMLAHPSGLPSAHLPHRRRAASHAASCHHRATGSAPHARHHATAAAGSPFSGHPRSPTHASAGAAHLRRHASRPAALGGHSLTASAAHLCRPTAGRGGGPVQHGQAAGGGSCCGPAGHCTRCHRGSSQSDACSAG